MPTPLRLRASLSHASFSSIRNLRIIPCAPYSWSFRRFYWPAGPEFWLYTVYEKGEVDDLTPDQKADLKVLLKSELLARQTHEGEEKKSLQ